MKGLQRKGKLSDKTSSSQGGKAQGHFWHWIPGVILNQTINFCELWCGSESLQRLSAVSSDSAPATPILTVHKGQGCLSVQDTGTCPSEPDCLTSELASTHAWLWILASLLYLSGPPLRLLCKGNISTAASQGLRGLREPMHEWVTPGIQ